MACCWTLIKLQQSCKSHQLFIWQRFFQAQRCLNTQRCLMTERLSCRTVLIHDTRTSQAHPYHFPSSGNTNFTSLYYPMFLSSRNQSKKRQQDSNDDADSDVDLDEDDFEAPSHFKVLTVHAPSLRADAVLSNSLNMSRHRIEELFFASRLLLNGATITKKGIKMNEGNYVDVIVDKSEDQMTVKRVKLAKIDPKKTGKDKFILKVRVWKSPFTVDHDV